MRNFTINGAIYSGDNIVITNNKILVNGKDVTPDSKEINISVVGNIEQLKVDACNKVSVEGSVTSISTQSGDVEVTGDISGGVQTMSGDVNCGNVGGSISTMSGDIRYTRIKEKF